MLQIFMVVLATSNGPEEDPICVVAATVESCVAWLRLTRPSKEIRKIHFVSRSVVVNLEDVKASVGGTN